MHRYSPTLFQLDDAARQYRGMSLLKLARESLTNAGVNTRGLSRDEVATRSLHSTSDFPEILSAVMPVRQGNPPPVMRLGAGRRRKNVRRLIRQQRHKPPPRYGPIEDNDAVGPDAANLKTGLGKVDRQYANFGLGCLPQLASNKTTLAHSMPSGGGIYRISSEGSLRCSIWYSAANLICKRKCPKIR